MTVTSMIPNDTPLLPACVAEVPKDVLRNYPHSKKVGNYLLGNTLGEGSFAKVKEALHILTGERVAVKIIDKKKSRGDSYVRRNLRREGKILQMINHPHIVQLLEIMETQNSYYLVTELCRGGDLMDYISKRRRLSELEVKKYIRQIVSAVDYLHRLGILHRDLKIENLLLDEIRDIKIIDFGLSNCVRVVQTKEGPKMQEYCVTQCGSPAYAAPELLGRKKYGLQVDLWSIGINMYAMLTGNLPFTVEPFNIKALYNKMINGQMNPVPEGLSRECRDIIQKFLTPDPEERITIVEAMKHPWITEVPGVPLLRASSNKTKTQALDNSILKHMTEVNGFRVGEIIRYVTGNIPSSATATYYLMLRKLKKFNSNPSAAKTPSKLRLLNRAQHDLNNTLKEGPESPRKTVNEKPNTNKTRTPPPSRPPSITLNNTPMVVTAKQNGKVTKAAAEEVTANREIETPLAKTETEKNAQTGEEEIPSRSCSVSPMSKPMSPPKLTNGRHTPAHLPNVGAKFVVARRRTATGDLLPNGFSTDARGINGTAKSSNHSGAVQASADDTTSLFRKRSSTFPSVKPQGVNDDHTGHDNSGQHHRPTPEQNNYVRVKEKPEYDHRQKITDPPGSPRIIRKAKTYVQFDLDRLHSPPTKLDGQHLMMYRRQINSAKKSSTHGSSIVGKDSGSSKESITDNESRATPLLKSVPHSTRTLLIPRAKIVDSTSTQPPHKDIKFMHPVSKQCFNNNRPVSSTRDTNNSDCSLRSTTADFQVPR